MSAPLTATQYEIDLDSLPGMPGISTDDPVTIEVDDSASPDADADAVAIKTNSETFCGKLYRTGKTAFFATTAVSLNTGIYVLLIQIGSATQGIPASAGWIGNFQVVGVVPWVTPNFALSSVISNAVGAKAPPEKINSAIIAGRRIALKTATPQAISLLIGFGVTYLISNQKTAASTRKFLIAYLPSLLLNNRIVSLQDLLVGNNDIKKLNILNGIYLSTAAAIFYTLNISKKLDSWSIGLAFTLSAFVIALAGEVTLHLDPKYKNSIFDEYRYIPSLVTQYQKELEEIGKGILLEYGAQSLGYISFIGIASLSEVASEATGTISQAFSVLTVIPQQISQAIAAAYVGAIFGKSVEKFKKLLATSNIADLDASPDIAEITRNFFAGGSIIGLFQLMMTSAIYLNLRTITRAFIPGGGETEILAIKLVSENFKYIAIASAAATGTEYCNAIGRKTKTNNIIDGKVQAIITILSTLLNTTLTLTESIGYETALILFMIGMLVRLTYQSTQLYRRGFNPLTQAQKELNAEAEAKAEAKSNDAQEGVKPGSPSDDTPTGMPKVRRRARPEKGPLFGLDDHDAKTSEPPQLELISLSPPDLPDLTEFENDDDNDYGSAEPVPGIVGKHAYALYNTPDHKKKDDVETYYGCCSSRGNWKISSSFG